MTLRRIVVLGTGTGIGKTTVTVALARALGELGAGVVLAVKPVETGYEPLSSDAAQLQAASRGAPAPRPHPLYAFSDPVSPHLAARRMGMVIGVEAIARWIDELEAGNGFLIIETAGGALSPLSERATNLDLARALEPARLVLVAPDSLGVLHELRASITAMTALHRAPDDVVLSRARPSDASTGTNADELRRLGLPAPRATIAANSAEEIANFAALVANAS
jgi:dethiobiotin synthetase